MTDTPQPSWPGVLSSLLAGEDLSAERATWVMDQVLRAEATPVQIAAFLVALRAKGETAAELRGLAHGMLEHAIRIEVPGSTLDIVGTGGDQAHTVNISTMSAIVAAGAGATVVKHGNRAASSSSGTADVLEHLGLQLALSPEAVVAVARQAGVTFCFAQTFHPALRHAGSVRREMGIPTALNVLGPLTNPAQPTWSSIGVAKARFLPVMAQVFADRGRDAAVFRGDDGLDELTVCTTSTLWWVRHGELTQHVVDPTRHGMKIAESEALRGGDPAYNAGVVRELLAGKTGAVRDAVLLNSAMALALTELEGYEARFGPASDLDELLEIGLTRARAAIDSGAAQQSLDRWIQASAEQTQASLN